ncbi:unnamed protein product [Rangifer tarandus platyrhynchus]|uniref:Uncharacterized protein n=3 Tax=Rangifer tarandus platyrhynchus TaxID=3082113 RepID=A0ABN8YRY3_RANTA|nr:unnamed protein product [Rangifer tarandus platyrhynchus]CAI9701669.1 unnamed protein product [Rangifer tarandus platyrhynchus]
MEAQENRRERAQEPDRDGDRDSASRSRSQRRSASGAAQSRNGRRGRPERLPGEPRLRRRKSPLDAASVSRRRHRPSCSRPGRPGPLPLPRRRRQRLCSPRRRSATLLSAVEPVG